MKNKKLAVVLTIILALPALFFLTFMFGEVFGGDLSGFSHLLQASPFIILIILIWKWPLRKKK